MRVSYKLFGFKFNLGIFKIFKKCSEVIKDIGLEAIKIVSSRRKRIFKLKIALAAISQVNNKTYSGILASLDFLCT